MNIEATPSFQNSYPDATIPADNNELNSSNNQASETEEAVPDAEETRDIQQLEARDREVRAHEAAHIAAGGSTIRSGASFTFERGPDGVLYATGGEVSIDTSAADTPEATLRKAEMIRRAALAPATPSGQDRAVAAGAAQMAAEARQEIMVEQRLTEDDASNQSSKAISSYRITGSLATPSEPNLDEMI